VTTTATTRIVIVTTCADFEPGSGASTDAAG
jgi:hypothetical protein